MKLMHTYRKACVIRTQVERKRTGGLYLSLSPCQTDLPISDSYFHSKDFLSLIRIFKDSFLTRPQWMWRTDWRMDWRLQQSKDLLIAGSQAWQIPFSSSREDVGKKKRSQSILCLKRIKYRKTDKGVGGHGWDGMGMQRALWRQSK